MLAQMLVAPAVALDVQPPMPLGSSDVPGNSQNRACPLKTSPNKAAMPFQRDSSTSSCSSWCSLLSCRRRWVLSGLYGEGVWFVSGFLKMYGASPFRVFNTRTGLDCGGLRGFLTSISYRRLNTLNMTIEQFSSSSPGAQLLWRAADVQQLAVERRWPDDRKLCPSGHAEAAHKKHVAEQPDLHARCYTSGSVRSTLHESSHTLSCQQLCPAPPPPPGSP